jgi:hypothetical protein
LLSLKVKVTQQFSFLLFSAFYFKSIYCPTFGGGIGVLNFLSINQLSLLLCSVIDQIKSSPP